MNILSAFFTLFLSCAFAWGRPVTDFRFASEATYPPFVILDAKGHVGGDETDMIRKACDQGGLQCSFSHAPWDTLLAGLRMGKFDAIYGGLAITPERKRHVTFSEPMHTSNVSLVFPCHQPLSWHDLAMQHVGLQQGVTFLTHLKAESPAAQLHTYDSIQQAFLDLGYQRLAGVVVDAPVAQHWLDRTSDHHDNFCQMHHPEITQNYGVAFRPQDTQRLMLFNKAWQKVFHQP